MGLCQAHPRLFPKLELNSCLIPSPLSTKNTVEPKNEFSWWTTWFQTQTHLFCLKTSSSDVTHQRRVLARCLFILSCSLVVVCFAAYCYCCKTGLRQPGWKTCEPPSFLRLPNTDLFSLKKRTVISQGPTTNTKKALRDEEDVLNEVCGGLQTF